MEYVGDEVRGAPVLQTLSLEPEEARGLFVRLVRSVEILLRCFRVHADLSAYNVLYWEGDVWLIDLPQCVDAMRHPEAFSLFRRDIDRLCGYFGRQGLEVDATDLAIRLWSEWI
jgi:RIO kinase 1